MTVFDDIVKRVADLGKKPIAFEAQWDGDTNGWFIDLLVTTEDCRVFHLKTLSEGGDIRVIAGTVPPWPEAVAAMEIGERLSRHFGVEFFFPSPEEPESDCPGWLERDLATPCRRCEKLLKQDDRTPWKGVCFRCHCVEEKEKKESSWTEEEKNGPRCFVCGNPANEGETRPLCSKHAKNWRSVKCPNCGRVRAGTRVKPGPCWRCQLSDEMRSLSEEDHSRILRILDEDGDFMAWRAFRPLISTRVSSTKGIWFFRELAEKRASHNKREGDL